MAQDFDLDEVSANFNAQRKFIEDGKRRPLGFLLRTSKKPTKVVDEPSTDGTEDEELDDTIKLDENGEFDETGKLDETGEFEEVADADEKIIPVAKKQAKKVKKKDYSDLLINWVGKPLVAIASIFILVKIYQVL